MTNKIQQVTEKNENFIEEQITVYTGLVHMSGVVHGKVTDNVIRERDKITNNLIQSQKKVIEAAIEVVEKRLYDGEDTYEAVKNAERRDITNLLQESIKEK